MSPVNVSTMSRPHSPSPPDALLLIGTRCPHCQATLDALGRLVKEGAIGRLTVINLDARPDAPEAEGVRSVPWTRLGPFELSGALSASELSDWAEIAAGGGGSARYFAHLIESGRIQSALQRVRSAPGSLLDLLNLFADPETPLSVRIGIGAIMEGLAGEGLLAQALPAIEPLALSDSPQIRADACWFLGLAGNPGASGTLLRLCDDEHAEVRESAADALALLGLAPAPEPN
jgi:thiol-disulfide isomerase/thioredoxin